MWKRGSICVTGLVFLLIGCAVYKPMQCKRPTEQWIVQIHEGEPIQKGSPSEQLQRSDYKSDYKEIYKPALYPVKTKPQVVLVCKYGKNPGEVQPDYPPYPAEGPIPEPIPATFIVDENNNIIMFDAHGQRVQVFDQTGKLKDVGIIEDYREYRKLRRQVLRWWHRSPIFEDIEIKIKEPILGETIDVIVYRGEKIVSKFKFKPEKIITRGLSLVQMDKNCNIYIPYNPKTVRREGPLYEGELTIAKFDTKGNFLGEIKIIHHEWYGAQPPYVALSGDIYVCNTDKDSLWIVRYPAKMFDESIGKYE